MTFATDMANESLSGSRKYWAGMTGDEASQLLFTAEQGTFIAACDEYVSSGGEYLTVSVDLPWIVYCMPAIVIQCVGVYSMKFLMLARNCADLICSGSPMHCLIHKVLAGGDIWILIAFRLWMLYTWHVMCMCTKQAKLCNIAGT